MHAHLNSGQKTGNGNGNIFFIESGPARVSIFFVNRASSIFSVSSRSSQLCVCGVERVEWAEASSDAGRIYCLENEPKRADSRFFVF